MNSQIEDRFHYKVANSPKRIKIDFNRIGPINFIASDIEDCEISGTIRIIHKFNRANFSRCRLSQVDAVQADFSGGDFKDCLIKTTRFYDVNFETSHLNTCYVMDSLFEKCFVKLTNFNKVNFDSVTFSECIFYDVLVKNCTFQNCKFLDCDINNKLFENCQILNTEIINTDLQIQSILDNYGLKKELWINSMIRTGRKKEKFSFCTITELEKKRSIRDDFDKLKIDFFLDGFCDIFFTTLDSIMHLESWKLYLTTPTTFYNQISGLSHFLNDAYENNEISIFPLLKLSEFLFTTTEKLKAAKDNRIYTLYSSLLGLHIANARITEVYLQCLNFLMQQRKKNIVFIVNGPLQVEYYKLNCPEIFADDGIEFNYLKEHNSPNELAFSIITAGGGLTALAAFLASRLQIEITKIKVAPLQLPEVETKDESLQTIPVFSVFAGRSQEEKMLLELRVKSLLPGSLMADLKLTFSLAAVNKLRKVLSGILLPEKS